MLRNVIKDIAPDAEKKISHPASNGIVAFEYELSEDKNSKESVPCPIEKPPPYKLISEIVKFRFA